MAPHRTAAQCRAFSKLVLISLVLAGCSRQSVPYTDNVEVVAYKPASAERPALPGAKGNDLPIATEQVCSGTQTAGVEPFLPRAARALSSIFAPTPVFAISVALEGGGRGDVHFTMVNGVRYDFQAVGEFIVLNSKSGPSFVVQARQQPYGSSTSVSVTTALAMNVAGDTVAVYAGQPAPLRVNHRPVAVNSPVIPLPHGGQVRREGNGFVALWPDKSQVRVFYGATLDYIVSLCPPQAPIEGLLGMVDTKPGIFPGRGRVAVQLQGMAEDTAFQQLYRVFGDSWRISQSESLFDYANGENTKTFTDLNFPYQPGPSADSDPEKWQNAEAVCRKAGIVNAAALRECAVDVAATGQTAFAINAAVTEAVYARSGANTGVDNLQCEGQQSGGFKCTIHNLMGVRVGTWVKLSVETLQGGKKGPESANCGPIDDSDQAPCTENLRGVIFEGGKVVETVTTITGEKWERRRPIRCGKEVGQPCGG